MTQTEALACTLTSNELRDRRSSARALLLPQVMSSKPLDSGLQIEFALVQGLRERVEEFVALERECCRFLNFSIDGSGDTLTVRIQGPPEAADVISLFRNALSG